MCSCVRVSGVCDREREKYIVCVCMREREREFVCACLCVRERVSFIEYIKLHGSSVTGGQ